MIYQTVSFYLCPTPNKPSLCVNVDCTQKALTQLVGNNFSYWRTQLSRQPTMTPPRIKILSTPKSTVNLTWK